MTSLAHLYVAAHIDEMLRRAADERMARARPARARPARAAKRGFGTRSAWSFLSGPAERPLILPTLTDYPYRG